MYNPVDIFQENAGEEKGEMARLSSFMGAIAISDLVKSTLGPRGMDKILESMSNKGEVEVTNDGATILKSILTDNPAAKILVDISKSQDDEVGDGTTSVCVFAGELLRESEKLVEVQNIHPQLIIHGFRLASERALQTLEKAAVNNFDDKEKFKEDLLKVARTTLGSKVLHTDKEQFANICVDAVLKLSGSTDLDQISIIKKTGGSLKDSFLEEGFILEKKIGVGQPKRIENAKILVANTAMDTDKIKIYAAGVRASSPAEIAKIEEIERQRMLEKCEKIVGHGINCFINRQLIYNIPEQYFADNNVMAIEHADFDGIERLSLVTGGEIASTFDSPETTKLGFAKLIEEIIIGEDSMIRFSGVGKGQACTIVLRGSSQHMLDEAERSIHDALCVLSQATTEPRIILGAGNSEMRMANAVDDLASKTAGKVSMAIEAFARALRRLPAIIADNGGYDSTELISQLKAAHYNGEENSGLDMTNGTIGDVSKLAILESFKVKRGVLLTGSEAAEMILRVDEILKSAPRQREEE